MPNSLEIDWQVIKETLIAGISVKEAARIFGVKEMTIYQRAKRGNWPTGTRLTKATVKAQKALKEKDLASQTEGEKGGLEEGIGVTGLQFDAEASKLGQKPGTLDKLRSEVVSNAVALTWAEKGESHRKMMFDLANKALTKAVSNIQPPKNWKDVEIADKVARRAAGLEDAQPQQNLLVSLGGMGGMGMPEMPAFDGEIDAESVDIP